MFSSSAAVDPLLYKSAELPATWARGPEGAHAACSKRQLQSSKYRSILMTMNVLSRSVLNCRDRDAEILVSPLWSPRIRPGAGRGRSRSASVAGALFRQQPPLCYWGTHPCGAVYFDTSISACSAAACKSLSLRLHKAHFCI